VRTLHAAAIGALDLSSIVAFSMMCRWRASCDVTFIMGRNKKTEDHDGLGS
jgi:hypothetical protein